MSRSCRFAGRPASAHVNTNPGSDLRRLPRKYDVKITSQSQTGLRRAATHRAEVQRACPGASFITATSTAGGRAGVRRIRRFDETAERHLGAGCHAHAICKWSCPDRTTVARHSQCPYALHTTSKQIAHVATDRTRSAGINGDSKWGPRILIFWSGDSTVDNSITVGVKLKVILFTIFTFWYVVSFRFRMLFFFVEAIVK